MKQMFRSLFGRDPSKSNNNSVDTDACPEEARDELFNGDDQLFKRLAANCHSYFEYGCGASTRWMLTTTQASIRAVDTNSDWVNHVRDGVVEPAQQQRLELRHVDLGDLGKWGRPKSYTKRASFPDYTDWLWESETQPDLVLIDGRFRVCCFLTSLRKAKAGTPIIFDDYVNRSHYHVVEEFVDRQEVCGRQALFTAPGDDALDLPALEAEISAFRYVMD